MISAKIAGRNASAQKYDILTALGAYALAREKREQRLVLRLVTLITARYNWARDELAVGQREIAQLWSVDERTVKREMARLRGLGWLVVRRQGARGRVTQYSIDTARILETTRADWPRVGPDFDTRLSGGVDDGRVVPLHVRGGKVPAPDPAGGTEWALAQAVLHAEDAGLYGSWLRAVTRESRAGGRLILRAPSRFHATYVRTHLIGRVLAACRAVDSDVAEIEIHA